MAENVSVCLIAAVSFSFGSRTQFNGIQMDWNNINMSDEIKIYTVAHLKS